MVLFLVAAEMLVLAGFWRAMNSFLRCVASVLFSSLSLRRRSSGTQSSQLAECVCISVMIQRESNPSQFAANRDCSGVAKYSNIVKNKQRESVNSYS